MQDYNAKHAQLKILPRYKVKTEGESVCTLHSIAHVPCSLVSNCFTLNFEMYLTAANIIFLCLLFGRINLILTI